MNRSIALLAGMLLPTLAGSVSVAGTARQDPVVVKPMRQALGELPGAAVHKKFHLASVIDKRGVADTATVGFTRVGRNSHVPLLCDPPPAELVGNALSAVLGRAHALSADSGGADYTMRVAVVEFKITEVSHFVTQTITAVVKYEASLFDPRSGARVTTFTIETEDSRTALDTTKYAETVARNALRSALSELMKSLSTS